MVHDKAEISFASIAISDNDQAETQSVNINT
jgi:hypothetical protein